MDAKQKHFNLDTFRMGYFILYPSDGSKFGKAIERAQLKEGFTPKQAEITHIEVSLGGQHSVAVVPPFAKVVDITKQYPGREVEVIRYKNHEYESRKRYKVAAWAASNCNLPYDIFGLIRFKLPFMFQCKRMFFCSENALWALQKDFKGALNGMAPEDCMPAHWKSREFETVWRGRIPKKSI